MSRLPFEVLLALRYLRPRRTFVSVITLISVLGVALGVAVLIIVISVMSGFDRQLRDRILGFNTHLRIFSSEPKSLTNYEQLMKVVSSNRNVKAVSPWVMEQVLIETEPPAGQSRTGVPWVRGIVPNLESNITVLPKSIIAGKFDVSDRGLVLGSHFANHLNVTVGDRVMVYSPSDLRKWRESEGGKKPVPPEYEVRGIFEVGYYEYDVSFVLASLEDAQEMYDLGNSVHGLVVMINDPEQAPAVAKELQATLGPDYRISTWMQENSSLLGALVVEKNMMFYLLFFIVIVAALCILSALITFVIQKTREIGMLKALGATDWQVAGLFLSQGGFVGVAGNLAGLGIGMLALAYRNNFLDFMNRVTGFSLFPEDIYGFGRLPAQTSPRDVMLVCGSALIMCLLGGVIPAWRAGRLKPVEALRYE